MGKQEAQYNLILGLGRRLLDSSNPEAWMVTISVQEQYQLVALQTSPRTPLSLGAIEPPSPDLWQELIGLLQARTWPLVSVVGPTELAQSLAQIWAHSQNCTIKEIMAQGVYALEQVLWKPELDGQLRPARIEEFELILTWVLAFHQEALSHRNSPDPDQLKKSVQERIKQQEIYVWETKGTPVSMSAIARRTAHGVAISLVYTPPELRGQGWASACVSALSQVLLDQGNQFCCLFTDLANPTSNQIYQRLGYQRVGTFADLGFVS